MVNKIIFWSAQGPFKIPDMENDFFNRALGGRGEGGVQRRTLSIRDETERSFQNIHIFAILTPARAPGRPGPKSEIPSKRRRTESTIFLTQGARSQKSRADPPFKVAEF